MKYARRIGQMMWLGLVAGTVALCLMPSSASSQTYFDRLLGGRRLSYNARSMALGNTGVASSYAASAMITNPALLWQAFGTTLGTNIAYADMSLVVARASENRIFPLLDTFGGYQVDNVYATNSPVFGYSDFGMLYKLNQNLYLGLGSFAYVTYDYEYQERLSAQLPSSAVNRDPFIGNQIIRSRATWRTYSLSMAWQHENHVSVGATLNLLRPGDMSDHYRYVTINSNYTAAVDTIDFNNTFGGRSSTNVIFGASYRATPHLLLGVAVESSFKLKMRNNSFVTAHDTVSALPVLVYDARYDTTFNSVTYHQPFRFSFGLEMRPENDLFSRITMEMNYTDWPSYKQTFSDSVVAIGKKVKGYRPHFDGTWDFRIGVEHMFFGYTPVRFGFSHIGSPLGDALVTSVFDIGTGFERGPLRLDASIEIANRDYRYNALFLQPGLNRTVMDKIEESTVRLQATLSYRFGY